MNVAALLDWYDRGHRPLPWRATRDPWAILVSEVMCQQTQAERVVPFWERFLARFPDPAACAAAAPAEVLTVWSGLGYNRRALALHAAARAIAAGGWPEDLRTLRGVGPYTAAAVASFAWNRPMAAVDTNVRRVLERHDGRVRAPRALQQRADALLPRRRPGAFNQAMMELGATVCRPRRPECGSCPVRAGCRAAATGGPVTAVRRNGPARERFSDSDRYVRGRIVAALVAGEPLPDVEEGRMRRAMAALERDGLVVRGAGGTVRLP